jgi:hypothetical protein
MTVHFDRMYPEMASIYATKYAVDKNIMLSIGSTILQLRRNVETALGVSTQMYRQEVGKPHIGDMVQGKADVLQFLTQQSDIMLKAHKSLTHGVTLRSPALHREISHHSMSFADDTDGQASEETSEHLHIPRLIAHRQHSGQIWSNLSAIGGGLTGLHKAFWQLISWDFSTGHPSLWQGAPPCALSLQDDMGVSSVIKYLFPNEPNVGLGFRLCPDGSQDHHFLATYDALWSLCFNAASGHMMESETRQFLVQ